MPCMFTPSPPDGVSRAFDVVALQELYDAQGGGAT